MTEKTTVETQEKKPLLLALGRTANSFFCSESRLHLIGAIRPKAYYKHAELTEDIKRGLRSGVIVDVEGVLKEEDVEPGLNFEPFTTAVDRKKQIAEILENTPAEKLEEDLSKVVSDILSEVDIDTLTKKDLVKFIESTEGMDFETLGLNGSSNADAVRLALKQHFGYVKAEKKDAE